MCTVSYIPLGHSDFVLTSNRDERNYRETNVPEVFREGDIDLIYPRDTKAGGTWIAINNSGRLCCLLNGAYDAHIKEAHHTVSRGTFPVLLASSEKEPGDFFNDIDLSHTEPFTLVTFDREKDTFGKLHEFIWDGSKKHSRELNPKLPFIWSSATLYPHNMIKLRKKWFNSFLLEEGDRISAESALRFHSGSHTPDKSMNLVMKREGGLQTVSITQVIPRNGSLAMKYSDLVTGAFKEVIV